MDSFGSGWRCSEVLNKKGLAFKDGAVFADKAPKAMRLEGMGVEEMGRALSLGVKRAKSFFNASDAFFVAYA